MSLNSNFDSDCAKIQESLSAYIDKEQVDIPNMEEHLSTCPHCQEVVKNLNQVKTALKDLSPSIPGKDFTSELESRLKNNNVVQGNFSTKAVAAVLIALVGVFGLWTMTNQTQEQPAPQIAVKENTPTPVKKIEKQPDTVVKITSNSTKPAKEQLPPPKPVKETIKTQIAQVELDTNEIAKSTKPVTIALNTPELSGEDGLFDEMGFASDEDGLYAIKL